MDFLLRRGRRYAAIEVKSGRHATPDALRGLRAIEGLPDLARRLLVHRGDRPQRTEDGIDVLPVSAFLRALREGTLL